MCPLKQNAFEYGMNDVFDLVKPFLQQRDQVRLSQFVKKKIALTLRIMNGQNPYADHAQNRKIFWPCDK